MINNTPIAGEAAARAGNSVGAFTIWISIPSERGSFRGTAHSAVSLNWNELLNQFMKYMHKRPFSALAQ